MQVTHLAISFLLHFLSISVEALHTPHHVHRRFSVDAVLRPNFTSSANSTTNSTSEGIPYWLEQIKHQGVAPFNTNSSYQVFRNVKDFGAKGDGTSDDTAAINLAISSGGRCAPGKCEHSTKTPAIVYFPAGTYKISASIIDYYMTQIIGNPNDLPVIKASSTFNNFSLIDGNQYQPGNAANPAGTLGFKATNVFYRQIKNLILDTTSVPANKSLNCVHWPTGQATSLQNLAFRLSAMQGTQHQGLFIEEGSGGFMSDLVFYGGLTGATLGNQQFTSRNLTFHNCVEAINQVFDWGWTYKSISINNCGLGFNLSSGGPTAQNVGSVTLIDSSITNTPIGILSAHTTESSSFSNGSLILDNVRLQNVTTAVQGPKNTTLLPGSSGAKTIDGWAQGHKYDPNGPTNIQGSISPFPRSASLVDGDKIREQSKPSYADRDVTSFLSVRSAGALGDGRTDDTAALQQLLDQAASNGKIVFFDSGIYKITKTLHIPPNSKLVGESYPVIMSSGAYFLNANSPKAVIQVGKPGDEGNSVEWSDMVVSTQGAQAGAILIEWNLGTTLDKPSGMWDVHTRIGGFAGSKLGLTECAAVPGTASNATSNSTTSRTSPSGTIPSGFSAQPNPTSYPSPSGLPAPYANSTSSIAPSNSTNSTSNNPCTAAFMSMHIAPSAHGLYLENVWLWTADHDLDAPFTNITVYSGRGMLVSSTQGRIWMYGTSVEHHALYQYQFAGTKEIFAGQVQTETAYYQPKPDARDSVVAAEGAEWGDPIFEKGQSGWGLRVVDSQDISIYGAGLYSFFDDYDNSCSLQVNRDCQTSVFSIEGSKGKNINLYNLNTVGTVSMIDLDGKSIAEGKDNVNVFPDTIAMVTNL